MRQFQDATALVERAARILDVDMGELFTVVFHPNEIIRVSASTIQKCSSLIVLSSNNSYQLRSEISHFDITKKAVIACAMLSIEWESALQCSPANNVPFSREIRPIHPSDFLIEFLKVDYDFENDPFPELEDVSDFMCYPHMLIWKCIEYDNALIKTFFEIIHPTSPYLNDFIQTVYKGGSTGAGDAISGLLLKRSDFLFDKLPFVASQIPSMIIEMVYNSGPVLVYLLPYLKTILGQIKDVIEELDVFHEFQDKPISADGMTGKALKDLAFTATHVLKLKNIELERKKKKNKKTRSKSLKNKSLLLANNTFEDDIDIKDRINPDLDSSSSCSSSDDNDESESEDEGISEDIFLPYIEFRLWELAYDFVKFMAQYSSIQCRQFQSSLKPCHFMHPDDETPASIRLFFDDVDEQVKEEREEVEENEEGEFSEPQFISHPDFIASTSHWKTIAMNFLCLRAKKNDWAAVRELSLRGFDMSWKSSKNKGLLKIATENGACSSVAIILNLGWCVDQVHECLSIAAEKGDWATYSTLLLKTACDSSFALPEPHQTLMMDEHPVLEKIRLYETRDAAFLFMSVVEYLNNTEAQPKMECILDPMNPHAHKSSISEQIERSSHLKKLVDYSTRLDSLKRTILHALICYDDTKLTDDEMHDIIVALLRIEDAAMLLHVDANGVNCVQYAAMLDRKRWFNAIVKVCYELEKENVLKRAIEIRSGKALTIRPNQLRRLRQINASNKSNLSLEMEALNDYEVKENISSSTKKHNESSPVGLYKHLDGIGCSAMTIAASSLAWETLLVIAKFCFDTDDDSQLEAVNLLSRKLPIGYYASCLPVFVLKGLCQIGRVQFYMTHLTELTFNRLKNMIRAFDSCVVADGHFRAASDRERKKISIFKRFCSYFADKHGFDQNHNALAREIRESICDKLTAPLTVNGDWKSTVAMSSVAQLSTNRFIAAAAISHMDEKNKNIAASLKSTNKLYTSNSVASAANLESNKNNIGESGQQPFNNQFQQKPTEELPPSARIENAVADLLNVHHPTSHALPSAAATSTLHASSVSRFSGKLRWKRGPSTYVSSQNATSRKSCASTVRSCATADNVGDVVIGVTGQEMRSMADFYARSEHQAAKRRHYLDAFTKSDVMRSHFGHQDEFVKEGQSNESNQKKESSVTQQDPSGLGVPPAYFHSQSEKLKSQFDAEDLGIPPVNDNGDQKPDVEHQDRCVPAASTSLSHLFPLSGGGLGVSMPSHMPSLRLPALPDAVPTVGNSQQVDQQIGSEIPLEFQISIVEQEKFNALSQILISLDSEMKDQLHRLKDSVDESEAVRQLHRSSHRVQLMNWLRSNSKLLMDPTCFIDDPKTSTITKNAVEVKETPFEFAIRKNIWPAINLLSSFVAIAREKIKERRYISRLRNKEEQLKESQEFLAYEYRNSARSLNEEFIKHSAWNCYALFTSRMSIRTCYMDTFSKMPSKAFKLAQHDLFHFASVKMFESLLFNYEMVKRKYESATYHFAVCLRILKEIHYKDFIKRTDAFIQRHGDFHAIYHNTLKKERRQTRRQGTNLNITEQEEEENDDKNTNKSRALFIFSEEDLDDPDNTKRSNIYQQFAKDSDFIFLTESPFSSLEISTFIDQASAKGYLSDDEICTVRNVQWYIHYQNELHKALTRKSVGQSDPNGKKKKKRERSKAKRDRSMPVAVSANENILKRSHMKTNEDVLVDELLDNQIDLTDDSTIIGTETAINSNNLSFNSNDEDEDIKMINETSNDNDNDNNNNNIIDGQIIELLDERDTSLLKYFHQKESKDKSSEQRHSFTHLQHLKVDVHRPIQPRDNFVVRDQITHGAFKRLSQQSRSVHLQHHQAASQLPASPPDFNMEKDGMVHSKKDIYSQSSSDIFRGSSIDNDARSTISHDDVIEQHFQSEVFTEPPPIQISEKSIEQEGQKIDVHKEQQQVKESNISFSRHGHEDFNLSSSLPTSIFSELISDGRDNELNLASDEKKSPSVSCTNQNVKCLQVQKENKEVRGEKGEKDFLLPNAQRRVAQEDDGAKSARKERTRSRSVSMSSAFGRKSKRSGSVHKNSENDCFTDGLTSNHFLLSTTTQSPTVNTQEELKFVFTTNENDDALIADVVYADVGETAIKTASQLAVTENPCTQDIDLN